MWRASAWLHRVVFDDKGSIRESHFNQVIKIWSRGSASSLLTSARKNRMCTIPHCPTYSGGNWFGHMSKPSILAEDDTMAPEIKQPATNLRFKGPLTGLHFAKMKLIQ